MKKYFHTIQNVFNSRWGNIQPNQASQSQKTDRVLHGSKLEDCIYRDLSEEDDTMQTVNTECSRKLHSFPALSQDIFQSFYSLFPKRNGPETLTLEAQKFNSKILDRVIEDADYAAIKSICEGRELPAYEAAREFTSKIGTQLDALLEEVGGKDGALQTLQKLQAAQEQTREKLCNLLEQMRDSVQNPTLEQSVVDTANLLENKTRQVDAVNRLVDLTATQNKAAVQQRVSAALQCRTGQSAGGRKHSQCVE